MSIPESLRPYILALLMGLVMTVRVDLQTLIERVFQ